MYKESQFVVDIERDPFETLRSRIIDTLQAGMLKYGIFIDRDGKLEFSTKCGCGKFRFTFQDFPLEDFSCPCERTQLIKYNFV